MGSLRMTRAAFAALVLAFSVAACGDDDDPAEPQPDAGIETMILTVGDQTVTVAADGALTGTLGPLPWGDTPVSASFRLEGGEPATNITPDRYTFEVLFADTLALDWTPGTGFSGTLTARAGGAYTLTFRLRDTSDNGPEITLVRLLDVDVGIENVRLVIGTDTLVVPAADALPSTEEIAVGPVPVGIAFLDENGSPAPIITGEAFTVSVTSSDTNIVAWTPDGPFSGTLRGVSPGVATVAVRLRSAVNGALAFQHQVTVIVE